MDHRLEYLTPASQAVPLIQTANQAVDKRPPASIKIPLGVSQLIESVVGDFVPASYESPNFL
jgi:hypothetical protein